MTSWSLADLEEDEPVRQALPRDVSTRVADARTDGARPGRQRACLRASCLRA